MRADCTVMVFRNGCLKRYIGLALKYGSMNGLPNGNNFWISRLEAHINNKMRSIGDYSYDWDYNVSSTKKAFLKVYIGPEFYQTVEYDTGDSLHTAFCRRILPVRSLKG